MNYNKQGWLGQIRNDGSIECGDSVGHSGHYLALDKNQFNSHKAQFYIKTFESKIPGVWVRYPDPAQTDNGHGAYAESHYMGCISRDQLIGIMHCLAIYEQHSASWRLVKSHIRRLFLFTNNVIHNGKNPKETKFNFVKLFYNPKRENYYHLPDLTGPSIWSGMIRLLWPHTMILWPILWILDIFTLFKAIGLYFSKESDIISILGLIRMSHDIGYTPVSLLAAKIASKSDVENKLTAYWSGWRKQPEMVGLFMKEVDKW